MIIIRANAIINVNAIMISRALRRLSPSPEGVVTIGGAKFQLGIAGQPPGEASAREAIRRLEEHWKPGLPAPDGVEVLRA